MSLYYSIINKWRVTTRNLVLYACNHLCQELTDGVRCMSLAVHIHHVIEAGRWVAGGGDFYNVDNLVGLCGVHHTQHTVAQRMGRDDGATFSPPDNGPSLVI